MKLNYEIRRRVMLFLQKHRLTCNESELNMLCYKVQTDIEEYHMVFRDAVRQEVEDMFDIEIKSKSDIMKSFQFGDYVLQGIPNAFNEKIGYWLSKKGLTVSMYCFTADTEKEVMYQLNNIQSHINCFQLKYENAEGKEKLKSMSCEEWAKQFAGMMIPSYLYKEIS